MEEGKEMQEGDQKRRENVENEVEKDEAEGEGS